MLKVLDDYLDSDLPFPIIRKQLSIKEESLTDVIQSENKLLYDDLKDWIPLRLIFKLHVCEKELREKLRQLFWQSFSYPSLLFFSYCMLFFLYRGKITPILLEQFAFFQTGSLPRSFTYLNIFHRINIFFVTIVILCFLILFKAKDLRMSFYAYLQTIYPKNPLTILVNHHFVLLWSLLAEARLNSLQAMKILRSKAFATHISWLAFQVEASFEKEATLKSIHLDELLAYMIQSKNVETNYKDIFPRYLRLSRSKIHYSFQLSAKIMKVWVIFSLTCIIYQYYMSFYLPLQFWEVL